MGCGASKQGASALREAREKREALEKRGDLLTKSTQLTVNDPAGDGEPTAAAMAAFEKGEPEAETFVRRRLSLLDDVAFNREVPTTQIPEGLHIRSLEVVQLFHGGLDSIRIPCSLLRKVLSRSGQQ